MDERIELTANEAFIKELDGLRKEGMSRADVLRRAVTLLSYATHAEREGRQLGFVVSGPAGNIVEEILEVE